MALLQDILYKVSIRSVHGNSQAVVKDVQLDSRLISAGTAFIAVRGAAADGHHYISTAIEKGAAVIICEQFPATLQDGITYVQVENSAAAAGFIAHNFYGQPTEQLILTGVTGTNGKTTIATLLFKLFTELGFTCGLVGTVQNQIGANVIPATHTTPDQVSLNRLLRQMLDQGCSHVFMETSSHALHQHRIAGLRFTGALFSNITHDHLDYHKTFDEYIRVKKSFFDNLPSTAFAISNLDDKRGTVMLQNSHARKYYYSLKSMADFKGKILENALTGLIMLVNDQEVHFRLLGEFNAYNLLAVYGAAICLQQDRQEILRCLSLLTGAEGRFDCILSREQGVMGIIDYAHTPDALANVLQTIQQLRKGKEQVITVVGCGGDRDKTKRPVMAAEAARYSDRVILTSDNPRSEDPQQILKDMEQGLNTAARRKTITIADRREAIKTAVSFSGPEDIVLVAGKGHEKYQEIKGVKYHFDDREEMEKIFTLLGK